MPLLTDFFNWFWGWAEGEKRKALEDLHPATNASPYIDYGCACSSTRASTSDVDSSSCCKTLTKKKARKVPVRGRNGRTVKTRNKNKH